MVGTPAMVRTVAGLFRGEALFSVQLIAVGDAWRFTSGPIRLPVGPASTIISVIQIVPRPGAHISRVPAKLVDEGGSLFRNRVTPFAGVTRKGDGPVEIVESLVILMLFRQQNAEVEPEQRFGAPFTQLLGESECASVAVRRRKITDPVLGRGQV